MEFTKDLKNNKLFIEKEFNASTEEVWKAWTDSEMLDRWWAPKPWKAKTKSMDFKEGGSWLYSMVGPEGEEHYARADYEKINPHKSFTVKDAFCDENGNINNELPVMHWKCMFDKSAKGTVVKVEITFQNENDLNKIIEMGFKEGFEAGLGNLEEIFDKQLHQN
jgi:uncharacterized protein YndB with AHSA1/START domain